MTGVPAVAAVVANCHNYTLCTGGRGAGTAVATVQVTKLPVFARLFLSRLPVIAFIGNTKNSSGWMLIVSRQLQGRVWQAHVEKPVLGTPLIVTIYT